MALIFNASKILIESLADFEFKLGDSFKKIQRFRALHLKLMQVSFQDEFYMGQNIYIRNRGKLTLGNRCGIGSFAQIWNYAPISIGDDFLAAANLTLNSGTHDPLTLEPQGASIHIGSRVWCGMNVTIIAGVTVGDDVVVGAGSLVTKDIPSRCVVAGVPAKRIRDIDRTKVQLWQPFTQ